MRQSQPTAQAEGLERRDAATSILKFHSLLPRPSRDAGLFLKTCPAPNGGARRLSDSALAVKITCIESRSLASLRKSSRNAACRRLPQHGTAQARCEPALSRSPNSGEPCTP